MPLESLAELQACFPIGQWFTSNLLLVNLRKENPPMETFIVVSHHPYGIGIRIGANSKLAMMDSRLFGFPENYICRKIGEVFYSCPDYICRYNRISATYAEYLGRKWIRQEGNSWEYYSSGNGFYRVDSVRDTTQLRVNVPA